MPGLSCQKPSNSDALALHSFALAGEAFRSKGQHVYHEGRLVRWDLVPMPAVSNCSEDAQNPALKEIRSFAGVQGTR